MQRIYDIGANIGLFTEKNLKKYPNCEFIVVDANPNLNDILKDKFSKHNNVKVVNLAISNYTGEIDFYINQESVFSAISTVSDFWMHESRFSHTKYNEPIKVKCLSLEDLINKYGKADYIKIDVEGHEKEIILSIKSYCGLVAFEFAEEMKKDIINIINHLHNTGYNSFYILEGDDYTFIPKKPLAVVHSFDEYFKYEEIINQINQMDENRKTRWGMIFCEKI